MGSFVNGSFDGILGLFQRNESDFMPFPYSMSMPLGLVHYSTVTNAVQGRIANTPMTSAAEKDLLYFIDEFGKGVFLGMLLMLTLLFIIYKVYLQNRTFSYILYHSVVMFFDQQYIIVRSVAYALALASFGFFGIILAQSINSDMVKRNFSQVVDSLNDLNRLKYVLPVFMEGSPFIQHFRTSTAGDFAEIWNRNLKMTDDYRVLRWDSTQLPKFINMKEHVAMIDSEYIGKISADLFCINDRRQRPFWISRKPFLETPFAFYLNVQLDKQTRRKMEPMGYFLAEGGFITQLWHAATVDIVRDFSAGVTPCCLKETMEELLPERNPRDITLDKLKRPLVVFLAINVIGVIIFLLELSLRFNRRNSVGND